MNKSKEYFNVTAEEIKCFSEYVDTENVSISVSVKTGVAEYKVICPEWYELRQKLLFKLIIET